MSTDAAEVGRRIATLRQRLGRSPVAFARQVECPGERRLVNPGGGTNP